MSIIHISLSFLFLFVFNFHNAFAAPTRHLCRPEQRDALLEFKNEFEIRKPSYINGNTESWKNNTDCCYWDGIKCDAKFGEVIELDLSGSYLYGKFHSNTSLFRLQTFRFLTTLDLSYNDIHGQIPSSIGKLSLLTSLDLSGNRFFGQVFSSIGNLSHFNSLDLSQNHFSGQIPSWIGNLSHLEFLSLGRNQFIGPIPSSIGNLSQLTSLVLSDNQFLGQIPSSIKKLSHLENLYLNSNNFTGEIPDSFASLKNLTRLDVGSNKLSGDFPVSLLNLTKLSDLYIGSNQLTGTLPPNISSLSNLELFSASDNDFVGTLPSSLFTIPSLRVIYLSNNNFTTIDLNAILSCSKSLQSLHLSGNHVSAENKSSVSDPPSQLISYLRLSGCGITEFPEIIRTQQSMSMLDISNNKIKGQVPGWLWTLPNLYYVDLSNNTFISFERPTKHRLSSNLRYLFGSRNNFTGKIPSFICAFSLSILDLSDNNFNGSIPLCMGNLKSNLSVLNLRQNRLSGGLLENVFESLRSLDFGHNQLVGKLPRSLIHSSTLEVVNVESNKINDTFPFWLSPLQNLQVLVLRSNAFHGPIHRASFLQLKIMDISHNHFSGILPSDYFVNWSKMSSLGTEEDPSNKKYMEDSNGYYHDSIILMNKGVEMELVRILKFYTALDFSGNRLEGEIPRSIGLLKELRVLNLSNNAFTGHIPSSMGNLTALESLDISQNKLSGEIPENVFESLRSLDVGHNQLVGKLPRSLIHFSTLEVLNVESNRINDTFPLWLSSLQNLQILVLRSNAFHGPIHQASFLMLKIIDISYNHFNGVLPSDYFVNWSKMSSLGTNEDRSNVKYMGTGYYEDSMVLMNKGVEMKLVRILTIYTALDFSGNRLEGEIPISIGLLKELHVLNMSNNAFTGHIPSSMGNLTALESLDVSQNKLSGEIPQELGNLSFLEYMNFSHNQLVGLVPGGTQFRTQPCSSFEDNSGLFGPALDEVCKDIHTPSLQQYETTEPEEEDEEVFSWIAAAIGFVPGIAFGMMIGYILVSYKHRGRSTTTH